VIRRHLIAWCAVALLAVANGAARDLVYAPFVGALTAHQISTILLVLVIGAAAWFFQSRWPLGSAREAMLVGAGWTIQTLAFECLIGRLSGKSWELIFADYDLGAGRIWVLIPVWLLAAPVIVYRMRTRMRPGAPGGTA
jgi:hypothetical protein